MAIIDFINKDGIFTLGNYETPKLNNIFTLPDTKRVPMLGLELASFYEQAGVEVANLEGTGYLVAWGFTRFKLKYVFNEKTNKLDINLMEIEL